MNVFHGPVNYVHHTNSMSTSLLAEEEVVKSPRKIIFFYEDVVQEVEVPKDGLHELDTPSKGRNNDDAEGNYKNSCNLCEESSALFLTGGDNKPEEEEKHNGRLVNTDILNDTVCSSRGRFAFERGEDSKVVTQEEGELPNHSRSKDTFANERIHESAIIGEGSNGYIFQTHEMEHVDLYTGEEAVKGKMPEGIRGIIFTCDSGESSGSFIEGNEEDSLEGEKTIMIPSNCESSSTGGDPNGANSACSSESTSIYPRRNGFDGTAVGKEKEPRGQPPEGAIRPSEPTRTHDEDKTSDLSSDNFADLNLSDSSIGSKEDVVPPLPRGSEHLFKIEDQKNEHATNATQDWIKKWQDCLHGPNIGNEFVPDRLGKLPKSDHLGEDNPQTEPEPERSSSDHLVRNPPVEISKGGNTKNKNTNIYSEQMKGAAFDCSQERTLYYNPVLGRRKKKKKKARQNGPIVGNIESTAHTGRYDCVNSNRMMRNTRGNSHSMGTLKCEDAPSSSDMRKTCICTDRGGKKTNPICNGRSGHITNCNQCRLYDLFRRNNRALSEVYFNVVPNSCRNASHGGGSNQLHIDTRVANGEKGQSRCCLHSIEESLCNGARWGPTWDCEHVNHSNMFSRRDRYSYPESNDNRGDCKNCNDDETNIQDSISVLEEKYASIDGSTETIRNGVSCGGQVDGTKMNLPFVMPYYDCASTQKDMNIYPLGHPPQGGTCNSCFERRLAQVSSLQRGETSSWLNMVNSNGRSYGVFPACGTCTSESDRAVSSFFPREVPPHHVGMNEDTPICNFPSRCSAAYEGWMVRRCSFCACSCRRCCCCSCRCDGSIFEEACKIVNFRNVLDNRLPSNYIDVDANPNWVRRSLLHYATGSGDRKTQKQQRKQKVVRSSNSEADKLNDVPTGDEDPMEDERKTIQRVAPGKRKHLFRGANIFGNSNGSEKDNSVYCVPSKDEEICVFPQEVQNNLEGIIMGSTSSVRSEDRNVDRCIQESSTDYHCERSAHGSNPNDTPPDRKKKKDKNRSSQKDNSGTKKQKKKKKKKYSMCKSTTKAILPTCSGVTSEIRTCRRWNS